MGAVSDSDALARAIDDLGYALGEAWGKVKAVEDSRKITVSLTDAILAWAQDNGWSAHQEEPIKVAGYVSSSGNTRSNGKIDIWCRSSCYDLAIEIDRANKAWSLAKLVQARQNGAHAVWVRWARKGSSLSTRSYPEGPVVPAGIHLIKLERWPRQPRRQPRG